MLDQLLDCVVYWPFILIAWCSANVGRETCGTAHQGKNIPKRWLCILDDEKQVEEREGEATASRPNTLNMSLFLLPKSTTSADAFDVKHLDSHVNDNSHRWDVCANDSPKCMPGRCTRFPPRNHGNVTGNARREGCAVGSQKPPPTRIRANPLPINQWEAAPHIDIITPRVRLPSRCASHYTCRAGGVRPREYPATTPMRQIIWIH